MLSRSFILKDPTPEKTVKDGKDSKILFSMALIVWRFLYV